MTHTPGPWRTFAGPGPRVRIVGPQNEQIGETYHERRDVDARLIAAAPELVEALRLNLAEQERAGVALGVGHDTPGMIMARALLSRLEGGQK